MLTRTKGRALLATPLFAGCLLAPSALFSQIVSLDLSNDVAWTSGAATVDDEGVRRLTIPATVSTIDLGALPGNVDVTAYHLLHDGRRLTSLATFADLGGGVLAGPEDVVAWNGAVRTLFFDGSAAGVPAGAQVDALGWMRSGGVSRTLLSFDVTVALPGGLTAEDEDVVAWNGSTWTLFFDGSAAGVATALDLDGFDRDPVTGVRYLSFDGSGKLGAVDFEDEDVLAWDGATWSLALDGSAVLGASFAAGDLDALGVRTVNLFRDGFETGNTVEWSSVVP